MKAITLARVSTKEQQENHSIAAQRQHLVDCCFGERSDVFPTFEFVERSPRGEHTDFGAMLEFAKVPSETAAVAAHLAGPDGGISAGGPGSRFRGDGSFRKLAALANES